VRASFARRLAKIDVLRSALEMWGEVVDCYTVLEERRRGAELVQERLRVKETPKLYVALGDLAMEPDHYSKA
jgi:uncharacterized protein HemY